MEGLDECRHWLGGSCVGAEGSAAIDGDWSSEVTKLQLENNTDPNHTVSDHITCFFLFFTSICYLKIGRFLAVEKNIKVLVDGGTIYFNYIYIYGYIKSCPNLDYLRVIDVQDTKDKCKGQGFFCISVNFLLKFCMLVGVSPA
jgi:hypothetical protein